MLLRTRIEWARRAAAAIMRRPSLFTVLVDPRPADARMEMMTCGFQQARRDWFGRRLLDVCMVRVGDTAVSASVTSHGTYRRHQFLLLAAVRDFEFPPRPLALVLEEVMIEAAEAVRRMERHLWPNGTPAPESTPPGLVLRFYDGRLAWQSVVDVPHVGVHTLIIAAKDGRVLFHKFDEDRGGRP